MNDYTVSEMAKVGVTMNDIMNVMNMQDKLAHGKCPYYGAGNEIDKVALKLNIQFTDYANSDMDCNVLNEFCHEYNPNKPLDNDIPFESLLAIPNHNCIGYPVVTATFVAHLQAELHKVIVALIKQAGM